MFRYIRKHHLFASLASYSFQNIHTDSHTNIQFDAANIHFTNFHLRFSHTGTYLLQNIRLEANIRETLSEFHIKANICCSISSKGINIRYEPNIAAQPTIMVVWHAFS
jgi:hypothetical protein